MALDKEVATRRFTWKVSFGNACSIRVQSVARRPGDSRPRLARSRSDGLASDGSDVLKELS